MNSTSLQLTDKVIVPFNFLPLKKKKSAIIISSSFRASLTYVLSSVLFLFLNMICEGFFKNNVHWNIRFYVRSALNLGRSLHASLLWVWKTGDGRCACVFVAWGGISETKTTDASGHFLVKVKEEPKKRNSSLNQLQRRRRKKVLRVLQRSHQQLLQGA